MLYLYLPSDTESSYLLGLSPSSSVLSSLVKVGLLTAPGDAGPAVSVT